MNPRHPWLSLQQARLRRFYARSVHRPAYARRFLHRYVPAEFFALEPGRAAVLDFGCGLGRFLHMFETLGYSPHGVDVTAYPQWRELRRSTVQAAADPLAYLRGSPAQRWDLILSFLNMEYVPDYPEYFRQFRRILKPGGWVVFQFCSAENLVTRLRGRMLGQSGGDTKVQQFQVETTREVLGAAGFTVLGVRWEGVHLPGLEGVCECLSNPPNPVFDLGVALVPRRWRSIFTMQTRADA